MTDPRTRLGIGLVLILIGLYSVVGMLISPAWTADHKLWSRVLIVSPYHARAMNNIGDALVRASVRTMKINTIGFPESAAVTMTYQDPKLISRALFFFAAARVTAKAHPSMPQKERNTVLAVADQNIVRILIGWPTTDRVGTTYFPVPLSPEMYAAAADYAGERSKLITEVLEELWQLQQSGSYIVR